MKANHPSGAAQVLGRIAGTLAIVAAAACSPNGFDSSDSEPDRTASADKSPHAATRSEQNAGATLQGVATFTAADVARIVLVLEQSSVAQARIAEERATTMEVKTYAARIVRERSEAMDRLAAILAETTPRSEDPTPHLFEREIASSIAWLTSQESGFDLPFMTVEIGAHARLLGMLAMSLLPSSTRSGALEEELIALRSATGAQMVHALRVQGVLRAAKAPVDDTTSTGGATAEGLGIR